MASFPVSPSAFILSVIRGESVRAESFHLTPSWFFSNRSFLQLCTLADCSSSDESLTVGIRLVQKGLFSVTQSHFSFAFSDTYSSVSWPNYRFSWTNITFIRLICLCRSTYDHKAIFLGRVLPPGWEPDRDYCLSISCPAAGQRIWRI